ncbi:MAG: hypothetical protein Q7T55_10590 [Solirubrobacteraceae bacterium]|nr:hypothetical protein [Solirubrobacteraceae bacterium]
MSQPPPTPPHRPTTPGADPAPRAKTPRAIRMRKLKVRAAGSTAAMFALAWTGIAVGGADSTATTAKAAAPVTETDASTTTDASPATDADVSSDDWSYSSDATGESGWTDSGSSDATDASSTDSSPDDDAGDSITSTDTTTTDSSASDSAATSSPSTVTTGQS